MRECARLLTVAKDREGFVLHNLVHEDADDVAVRVAEVLALAIDVVWAEDDVIEPEQMMAGLELLLHGELRDPIGILRLRNHVFAHRQLAGAVHGDGGREHEAFHAMIHAGVNEVDAAYEVVLIIEPLDEVAQTLCGVSREMEDVLELVFGKQTVNERVIEDAPL